jgi:hypothetical protein
MLCVDYISCPAFVMVSGDGDKLHRLGPTEYALYLRTEAESSLDTLNLKNGTMYNVQKVNYCTKMKVTELGVKFSSCCEYESSLLYKIPLYLDSCFGNLKFRNDNDKSHAFGTLYTCTKIHVKPYRVLNNFCFQDNTIQNNIVAIRCDCRRGLDWWMDLLTTYTRHGTTSSYSATANLNNSQITAAPAKPFPACYVFTSRSLATAANSGDSSASRAQDLFSQPPVQNSLSTEVSSKPRLAYNLSARNT